MQSPPSGVRTLKLLNACAVSSRILYQFVWCRCEPCRCCSSVCLMFLCLAGHPRGLARDSTGCWQAGRIKVWLCSHSAASKLTLHSDSLQMFTATIVVTWVSPGPLPQPHVSWAAKVQRHGGSCPGWAAQHCSGSALTHPAALPLLAPPFRSPILSNRHKLLNI